MKKLLVFVMVMLLSAPVLAEMPTTLSWTAPTTNSDGTPLTDLAGYKIYFDDDLTDVNNFHGTLTGDQVQDPDCVIDAGNVVTFSFDSETCEGVGWHSSAASSQVTMHYTVTAYDTTGNNSDRSNVVSKDFFWEAPVDILAPLNPTSLTVQ